MQNPIISLLKCVKRNIYFLMLILMIAYGSLPQKLQALRSTEPRVLLQYLYAVAHMP